MNQQLQDRITELVLNGDAPSLIWMFEGQLRITDLAYARIAELEEPHAYQVARIPSDPQQADRASLDYCNGEVKNCLDKVESLEATNTALRESYDELRKAAVTFSSTLGKWNDGGRATWQEVINANELLVDALYPPDALVTFATDHGIPLPEQEDGQG